MAALVDLSSLLLGFETNPGVAHLLCQHISRTGVICKAIRSHEPGQVAFDVETWPEQPGQSRRPAVYTLHYDRANGQPQRVELKQLGG